MSDDNLDGAADVEGAADVAGGIGPGHDPAAAPAGWHPDPWASGQRRYWNGRTWTPDVFADRTVGEQAGVAARQGRTSPFQDRLVDGGAVDAPPAPNWTAPTPAVAYVAPPVIRPLSPEPPKSRTALAVSLSAAVALAVVLVLLFAFLRPGSSSTAADSTPSASSLVPSPSPTTPSTPPSQAPTPTPSAGAPTPSPGTTGQPGTGGGTQTDPQAAALQNLGLRQSDVTGSVVVSTIPGGDQVANQTTLDLCNANYSSESLRTARHQVAAVDIAGDGLLSTEAVLYKNDAAAKLALAELRRAAAECPATPVTSPTTGNTQITVFAAAPDKNWPAVATVTRQAYEFTSTDLTGATGTSIAVYLQRGRALLAVYFFQPTGQQTSVDKQTTVQGITEVFEKRLAALPNSVVANP